jgi:hypothetical protein
MEKIYISAGFYSFIMSGDDEPKPHNVWRLGSSLLCFVRNLPEKLERLHADEKGNPTQMILYKEEALRYAWIDVWPVGVKLTYMVLPSNISSRTEADGSKTQLLNERVLIAVSDKEYTEVCSAFLAPGNDKIPLTEDDELLQGVRRDDPKDVYRAYEQAWQEVIMAGLQKGGKPEISAEVNLPGADYRINLDLIYKFDGDKRIPSKKRVQDIIFPTLEACVSEVSYDKEYDKLFILGDSYLIDCGDSSLFADITDKKDEDVTENEVTGNGGKLKEAVAKCVEKNKEHISYYSYDGSLCPLIEHEFPDTGLVYVCTKEEGLVKKIFDAYVAGSKAGLTARVDQGRLVFSNGLRMSFIGEADEEFQHQEEPYSGAQSDMDGIW